MQRTRGAKWSGSQRNRNNNNKRRQKSLQLCSLNFELILLHRFIDAKNFLKRNVLNIGLYVCGKARASRSRFDRCVAATVSEFEFRLSSRGISSIWFRFCHFRSHPVSHRCNDSDVLVENLAIGLNPGSIFSLAFSTVVRSKSELHSRYRSLCDCVDLIVLFPIVDHSVVDWKLCTRNVFAQNHVPGVDGVGIVIATGANSPIRVGTRVAYHTNLKTSGSFARHTVVGT